MSKLSYDTTYKLENLTRIKLTDYINKNIKTEEVLKEIYYSFPFPFENENMKSKLDHWLHIDYKNKNGKTFIDTYLEENSHTLTNMELDIFMGKKHSFLSLFEVIDYEEDYLNLLDVLQNIKYRVLYSNDNMDLKPGDYIFTRIGKALDEFLLFEEINILPNEVKSSFMENFIYDLNLRRKKHPNMLIKEYLKDYSLILLNIFNNCILEALDAEEELSSYLFDELDGFEEYLLNKSGNLNIGQYVSTLMDFFEYYLFENGMYPYDLEHMDFMSFIEEAIEDELIISYENLNDFINTMKYYTQFLSKRNSKYNSIYESMMYISENRFLLMKNFSFDSVPYKINPSFSQMLYGILNEGAINFLNDFDKFIIYVSEHILCLTEKKRQIKNSDLLNINDLLYYKIGIVKTNAQQKDYTFISLIYTICLNLRLMDIADNYLLINKYGENFISLNDEEKYSLILSSVWKLIFSDEIGDSKKEAFIKDDLIDIITKLSKGYIYDVKSIINDYPDSYKDIFEICSYLISMGIIKRSYYPNYTWQITKLGTVIVSHMTEKKDSSAGRNVVSLDKYRSKE